MFKVAKNQVIKIHKGDDSGEIKLVLNQGNQLKHEPFILYPDIAVTYYPENTDLTINKETFISKFPEDGFYTFEYNYVTNVNGQAISDKQWTYNRKPFNLLDAGIEITGSLTAASKIKIAQFTKNPSIISLYIIPIREEIDQWIFKKDFYSTGITECEIAKSPYSICYKKSNYTVVIDEIGNAILSIDNDEIDKLKSGEYDYEVKAKLYDTLEKKYIKTTVIERNRIYVIDGDDNKIW